jgi:fructose-1,6-bisphosphatase/inositol monophosphatase family enzyme
MMVALLRGGVTVASWVLDPIGDSLTVAEAGSGTYVDGVRIEPPSALPPAALRGAAMTWFFPDKLRRAVERGAADLAEVGTGQHCAGREYLDIVTGRQHFVLFWRTLPWDHVPGSLLVREAGGVVRRLDGGDYHPTDDRAGLLAAASEEIWRDVRDILLPGLRG